VSEQIGNDRRPSRALRAVLTIFNSDEELKRKALPYVDIESERIDWEGIFQNDFGGGHGAAVKWSQAIWEDRTPEGADPFCRALAMDDYRRRVVLKALAIRWGLTE
jgi:hypothetical protein